MSKVSVNQTATVVLSASDPTLVVESGVSILSTTDDGVYGDQTAVWNVTNEGTITSDGAPQTNGVYLQGPGSIVTNDGAISGAGGVFLGAGGTVTNALNASISASGSPGNDAPAVSGIDVEYGLGAVNNYGTIGSDGYGVALEDGGVVTNYATGSITGALDAVYLDRASAVVDNYGKLTAKGGDGVGFYSGGTLINEVGGTVTASTSDFSAVNFQQFPGTLQNDGVMQGAEAGAYFMVGGTVVNGAKSTSALLQGADFGVYLSNLPGSTSAESVTNYGAITATASGSYGVYVSGNAGTVTNAGAITGAAYSVDFAVTSAANRLIVDPGAIFNGLAYGGGGTLELAGTSASAFSAIIGPTGGFESFSALQVDAGSTWTLSAKDTISTVQLNGVLEVASSLAATSISFGAGGKLIIDSPSSFTSPLLENFVAGDVIDIHGIAAAGATISYNSTTGVATIANGGQTKTLDFQASTLEVGTLQVVSDGGTGLDVVFAPSTPTEPVPPVTPPAGNTPATEEISTNQSVTVELSASAPILLVDAKVQILSATSDGVYGNDTAVWTVTNNGAITSNGAPGTTGIYLQGPSSIVTNNGSVSGAGGMYLGAGGTVTNALGASIESNGSTTPLGIPAVSGVNIEYGIGTVNNYGTIGSDGYGVGLQDGGAVTNYASGSITGAEDAVYIDRSYGTVENYGQLTATVDDGVGFFGGGTLINEIGGTVTCVNTTSGTGPSAVFFSNFSGTLQNDGAMHGTQAGAYFTMGGTVVNGANNASALLQGDNYGVYLSNLPGSTSTESVTNYGTITAGTTAGSCGVYIAGNAGTVTNAGTITGGTYSVDFAVNSAANRLVVDPGAIFNGLTVGGGGTLELAGTSAGTFSQIIGPTGNFEGFSALQVDAGATWELSQDDSIPTVLLNGSLEVYWSLTATSIVFGAGGKLIVDNAAPFTSPLLENFVAGDVVDIHGIAAAGAEISYNATTGVATIVEGAQTATLDFQPSTLGAGTLQLVSDGGTGLDVVLASSTAPTPPAPVVTAPVSSSIVATYQPTISGTGVAGDIVSLSIDGAAAVTTKVASNGTWSYTLLTALTNASHTVTATQAAPGGPSSTAATDTFTVSVPPAAPTITTPASGSTDTTTTLPVISGGGVTGDTVTINIDGVQVGTALVANSAWSFSPTTPLANASHTITATQAAPGGPSSTAATDTFTVSVPPPAPTITTPASGSTDTTTPLPVISGGGVTGDTVTVNIDGVEVGTALVANSAWSFTPTTPLANASHTITATQAATGGPSSTAATDTFTVSVPPAAPTITTPASGSTDTTTPLPVISGGGVTGDTVTVKIDGVEVGTALVANSAWSFSPTTALANASHTITATQAAPGGPSSTAATDTFTVSVPPAAPTITTPANGSSDTTADPLISGSGVTGDTVTVNIDGVEVGTATVVNSAWSFTMATALANASHTITATQAAATGPSSAAASDTFIVNVAYPPAVQTVHANDISRSGSVTGSYNFIDLLNLEASYADLIDAFGTNEPAMQNWFNAREAIEQRPDTFDGLDYIASYGDLINAFKGAGSLQAVLDAGAEHYITYGHNESRTTSFNGLDYIASYGDLIKAFGVNGDAGAYHYIEHGVSEGRTTTFDGLDYIASYTDLIKAFGANEQAGAEHFIEYGYNEGRTTTFDGLDYIAGYTDLMKAFGANNDAGATHYIDYGLSEGRSADPFNVAAYEAAHPDLSGKYASDDAFLTAYINTYATSGKFLT